MIIISVTWLEKWELCYYAYFLCKCAPSIHLKSGKQGHRDIFESWFLTYTLVVFSCIGVL